MHLADPSGAPNVPKVVMDEVFVDVDGLMGGGRLSYLALLHFSIADQNHPLVVVGNVGWIFLQHQAVEIIV